ncbi:MAG: AsmA family protein [Planctomycetota bacterium]|nr:AsmA family protein [Planctomycetota bacterium]
MAAEAPPATSKPPRKPRWRRRLVVTLLVLFVLVLLAPLAVGLGPVRSLIADKVGAALGRQVDIGGSSAFWFSGIDLEDITVHSPEGFDGPLATVAKVHADVDVFALLGGDLTARLRIVQPHVTLRRNAAGDSNTQDLGQREAEAAAPEKPAKDEEPAAMDVQVVLVAGTVEALDGAKAENALRDIQLTAGLSPGGGMELDLQALAEGAGEGGKDARLDVKVQRGDGGEGTFRFDVPALQLARLARLVEDTLAVTDLRGTVQLDGEGTLHADDTVGGTVKAHLAGIGARTPDGTQLSVHRVMATAKLRSVSRATEVDIGVGMGDVRVRRTVDGRVESFREPDISLQLGARIQPEDGLVRVAKGSLQGGELVQVLVKEPLRIESGAATRFEGQLDGRVSLGRLGSLRGLFPALEPLATGVLSAKIVGGGADAREVGVGVSITDLALRPSDLAPDGYSEPRIVAAFRVGRTEDDTLLVRVTQLAARIVRLTPKDPRRGITLTLADGGAYALDGDFTLGVGLESLSRLMGSRLGLAPGERLGGTLQFIGTGRGTPEAMRLSVDVHGTRIVFPPSWGRSAVPAALKARLVTTREGGESRIDVTELAGLGLSGSASARLRDTQDENESAFREGEADLMVDLGRARPWLGGFLGMAQQGRLGGRARLNARLITEAAGRRLAATTQVNDLLVQTRPGLAPVREPRLTLSADVLLADAGGRHEARELKLDAAGLKLDLSGSTYVAEPDVDMDVNAVLGGDAAQLAPTLAALLGPGYEDLRGRGRLTGTIKANGSPADRAAALFTTTDLALGSWSTSGLNLENVLVRATRTDPAAPLALRLESGMNGGTALITGNARLGGERIPWDSTVTMKDIDTSTLVVSQGLGRYLTFVLPALLPAKLDTPVLSGRLSADLKGGAPALMGEALKAGLRGQGRIEMQQGEIKQSTLFGGGNEKLGKLVTVLGVVASEAGTVLAELQKAITFSSLVSEFSVANRVVHVKQTTLTGRRVAIDMQGTVQMAGGLDLRSRAKLQGNAGRRLGEALGSDTLPLRVRGTLEKPQVEPDVDLTKLIPVPGKGKDDLLDEIRKKLPKLPKPPKLPKLPNPFK